VYLTFRVGGRNLALPIERTREVLSGVDILSLPGTRPAFRGILLRDGVAVPVVDLSAVAGDPPSELREPAEVVIVDAEEIRLALLAEAASARPLAAQLGTGEACPVGWTFLDGSIEAEGVSAWLLDPDALARTLGAYTEAKEKP
jgi:chemotaxis-related protein WspB